ncbi:hypothetical protein [Actinomadura madurae]|uniref:hypothetical protein n=1 Tax=Actinomadura madurae TaxID=1993 RepID=UPI00202755AB|nr:hypothetical protein [Actinomadura madurae]MCP9954045.1 hypothetical protein [Actinomadura madurae]MCP9970784.1 hypothetical protein [Actinomadura madurae]MCP9983265.1 hypothetical protein [Actinomadura madurae]URM99528.1 hypothetical protein LUW76_37335 [Actinomadura madurae]URN10193.1 hypothetical protein LUW74_47235 [Actinomadura madurae]
MPHDLPAWVAELTDPRRAETLDELADRLVPLAEHAIDVSRRLQAQLNELNDPFKREALYGRVERLKARAGEALEEITSEITASGEERIERVWAEWAGQAGPGGRGPQERELRRVLDREIVPVLSRQQQEVAARVAERTSTALEAATQKLLTRVEELAKAVTDLIHDVLPLAREGLALASRISTLSGHARKTGRGPVPDELKDAGAETSRAFDEAVARLELEWAALGARSATVRAALRGAEESAFSQVTEEMTRCVEELAPRHVQALNEAEAKARSLFEEARG